VRLTATVALLASAALLAVAPGGAGGRAHVPYSRSLLVVGDSLTVGTRPYLPHYLPHFRIHQDVAISTQVTQGPGIMRRYGRHLPRVVFVNLGTNGDPRATGLFDDEVRHVMHIAGKRRCVVWATIVRPPVAGASYARLNRVLADEARKRRNLMLFRWVRMARAHPSWFGPDHVHVTATAYRIRAKAMAEQIRACRMETLARGR
jgi:hypothetical protein